MIIVLPGTSFVIFIHRRRVLSLSYGVIVCTPSLPQIAAYNPFYGLAAIITRPGCIFELFKAYAKLVLTSTAIAKLQITMVNDSDVFFSSQQIVVP